jgi:hypothetical protein
MTRSDILKKESDILSESVKFKDEHLISDKSYSAFQKKLAPNNPNLYRIRKERRRQNSSYFKHYRNEYGNYVDCQKNINYQIRKNFKRLKIEDNTIQVKLCGDSTRIGNKIKKLNLCFTLPGSGLVAKTVRGNYTLGIFKLKKENYDSIKDCLSEVTKNLTDFSEKAEFVFNNITYKIKFLLGGDMVFLHEMMGFKRL